MSKEQRKPHPDPVMELCGHSPVTSLKFADSDDGGHSILYSGHELGQILVWDLRTQRPVATINAHGSESVIWLHSLSISSSNGDNEKTCVPSIGSHTCILISQGRDGYIKLWKAQQPKDLLNWVPIEQLSCALYTFCNSSIISYDETYLLSVPHEDAGKVENYSILKQAFQAPAHSGQPRSTLSPKFTHACVPPSTKEFGMCMRMRSFLHGSDPRLIAGYESGTLAIWSLVNAKLLCQVKAHSESLMCLDVWMSQKTSGNSQKSKVISGSVDKELKSWELSHESGSENRLALMPGVTVSVTNAGFGDVAIRPDGRIVVSGGWDSMGRVFSASKLRQLAVLSFHKKTVQCVAFSNDHFLAIASKDGLITLWDVYKDS